MIAQVSTGRLGLIQALLACAIWGVMPIYFKLLQSVPALEVVAHRIIWSVPLLLVMLYFRKNLSGLRASWADRQVRRAMLASSVLIAGNWLVYVWAVQEDHILADSLGYFISPLGTVFLARIFLKENLSRNQWIAVAIAGVGVSILAAEAWQTLWISRPRNRKYQSMTSTSPPLRAPKMPSHATLRCSTSIPAVFATA